MSQLQQWQRQYAAACNLSAASQYNTLSQIFTQQYNSLLQKFHQAKSTIQQINNHQRNLKQQIKALHLLVNSPYGYLDKLKLSWKNNSDVYGKIYNI